MRNGVPWNVAMRDFALIHAAVYDAMIAAWDAKYAYNRKRPSEVDPDLAAELAVPLSPSYPSEHAVAAGAAAAGLSCFVSDPPPYYDAPSRTAVPSQPPPSAPPPTAHHP